MEAPFVEPVRGPPRRLATAGPDGAPHVTPLGCLDPGHEALVTGGHAGTRLAASRKFMPGRPRQNVRRRPVIQIAIIVGSTRPGRRGETVARWVAEAAGRHPAVKAREASVELVNLADYGLPLLDEPLPAASGHYQNAHTKR